MHLRTEIGLSIAALLVVQLSTSFAAVGLLSRMSPAVERIVEENLHSEEAALDILAILAAPVVDDADRINFRRCLERARSNITEEGEANQVATIERYGEEALEGEPFSRAAVVEAALGLAQVNQRSMRDADHAARRLGLAGAWTAVLLGLVSFALSLAISRRLTRRIDLPLYEMEEALNGVRQGDTFRRVSITDSPVEVLRIADGVNALLDASMIRTTRTTIHAIDPVRAALLKLLDERPIPTLIVDEDGTVVATNRAAMALENAAVGRAARGEDSGWTRQEIGDGVALLELKPTGSPA